MSHAGPSTAVSTQSAAPQWRQFNFFDAEEVKDAEDLAQSPRALRDLKPPIIISPTSPETPLSDSVILSTGNSISLLDRHFATERSFPAWEGNGRATSLAEVGGLLVAIGEDESSRHPVLKIWDLTKEKKGVPVLLRNVRIQHGQRPHPVSCMAITSNLSHLAIGLGDGTVLLYRHLLQSLANSPAALTSLPRARVLHESHEPITGLGFREPSSITRAKAPENDRAEISLYIVTTNRVLSAPVATRGGDARTIDEEKGAGLGCAIMDWNRRDMIVARDDGIYLYGPEGRGACYAYEGPKSSIAIYRSNLIITSPPFYPTAGSNSATVRNYVAKTAGTDGDIAKVTVFDLANKLVSYSGTYREGVRDVFCQWSGIYVYGSSGKLSRLEEHTTNAKLEVLYRRNLYTLAVTLARSSGLSESGISEIYRRYGDHLYTKGDFDGAMEQYVKTLGHLQPSYVIRKYLDAQRIHNLITYLQELHSRNLANPDHTTLLLNCYTKTSDRTRLDAFIKSEATRKSGDELPFDLDTAIRVCRQAGFYEHATYLAKKYGKHEEYLRIQLEDAGQWEEALSYLRNLGPEACRENLLRYGRTLLDHHPEATTELLIDLCAGNLGRKPTHSHVSVVDKPSSSAPAMLSYLGYNRVTGLLSGESGSSRERDAKANGAAEQPDPSPEPPAYDPPSPTQYFAHFLDHPALFIHFLESIALALWDQAVAPPPAHTTPLPERSESVVASDGDQCAVWNTLLELYLMSVQSADTEIAKAAKTKALGLLAQTDLPYDPMHALILCSSSGFTEGLVRLWESMGMYEDVLRHWMEQGSSASDEVLRHLDLYGPTNPQLYPLVLRYLTSSPAILSRHPQQLSSILEKIDDERIMPPLAVVQLLSRNGVASVGSVKDWLRSKVADTRDEIDADKSLVESYRSETASKQRDIQDLANVSQPEVFQVTRCAACSGQLDLPSVHFMCKHSYHQRCLSDADPECPLCARNHSIIREVRRNQTRLADRHDLFVNEVHEAEDGFAVVAGAFGRGVMGKKVGT